MTLPTSGPISLNDIQTEFGGSAPTSLSEYYAGGGLVPSGTSGTNGPVPSSGPISLASFYGTSNAPTITLSNHGIVYASGGLFQAQTAYRVANDAFVYQGAGTFSLSYTQDEQWNSQPGTVSSYEIYVSKTSGTTPSGTLNTWLNLGTTRDWVLTAAAGNSSDCVLAVQIRDVATATVRATATITLLSDAS